MFHVEQTAPAVVERKHAWPVAWDGEERRGARAACKLHKTALGFPLLPEEVTYLECRAVGFTASMAWKAATGSKVSSQSAGHKAARWLQERPWVAAELAMQRQTATEAHALTRATKRAVLAAIACGDVEARPEARIAAIGLDNAMTGENEPTKVHVSGRVVFSIDPTGLGRGEPRVAGVARPLLADSPV